MSWREDFYQPVTTVSTIEDFAGEHHVPSTMSLSVGGYGQGYHHPGPMAHHPHHPHPADFYPQYPHQMRYSDHPDHATTAAGLAAAGYFPNWMIAPGEEHIPVRVDGGYPMGSPSEYTSFIQYENGIPVRCIKRRVTANKKERRRTLSINNAFAQLRGCIPNVPSDTKLSKIKTLRLATSYISYLMELLSKDNPDLPECFKAEIGKKPSQQSSSSSSSSPLSTTSHQPTALTLSHVTEAEKRKRESEGESPDNSCSPIPEKRTKGRTGWPQHVWAAELKQ